MSPNSSGMASHDLGWPDYIVEVVPCALVLVDAALCIRRVNRAAEVLLGYSRVDLLDHSIDVLIPEELRRELHDHIARLYVNPRECDGVESLELLLHRRDGSAISASITMSRVHGINEPSALLSIADSSYDAKSNELAQRMVALVESADDAIITKSLDGVVRSWNPGAERLLGYRSAEIVGHPIIRLIPADRQDEERMIIDRISHGRRVDHFETIRLRKDGSQVHVSLTISPLRDRFGTINGASKIMRDISDRKSRETELRRANAELARLNSDLEDFVYTASHDLRAPLTGINSVVQWILDDDRELSKQSRARMKLIQGRIERMKRLLNDIRDYAQSGDKSTPSGATISVADLLKETSALLGAPKAFAIHGDPSLAAVTVHRFPLEQLLNNLIGNAIKHHDRATGIVKVSVESIGAKLRFFIEDDGPGIPVEYRDTIFEMFKTLRPRDEIEGSGMGLALVRKIVNRMGGECGVEPAGTRGAIFWFDWPRLSDGHMD